MEVVGQMERRVPAAAKAGTENTVVIAAVNRCATQKQELKPSFSANCKDAIEFAPVTARLKQCPFKTNLN